jgi:hypothetical protein
MLATIGFHLPQESISLRVQLLEILRLITLNDCVDTCFHNFLQNRER